jgi:hypothetical protein
MSKVNLSKPEAIVVEVVTGEPHDSDILTRVVFLYGVFVLVLVLVLNFNSQAATELVVPVLKENTGVGITILFVRVRRCERFFYRGTRGSPIKKHLVKPFSGKVFPLFVFIALPAATTTATAGTRPIPVGVMIEMACATVFALRLDIHFLTTVSTISRLGLWDAPSTTFLAVVDGSKRHYQLAPAYVFASGRSR